MTRFIKILIFAVFILATLQAPVDLDLGWHLRYGEYFFQTGKVLKDNIISSVWPDYKWVQASWGYDLLVYQMFTRFGFIGLSLGSILITLLIFWLLIRPVARFSPTELFLLGVIFLSQTPLLYYTGLRSQTPSTLLFALALVIGDNLLKPHPSGIFARKKTLLLLPLIFLIWTNMHGGFTLGLAVLGILWMVHGLLILAHFKNWVKTPVISLKNWLLFGIFFVASLAVPIINPWGIRIYEETLKHSTNLNLTSITEWMPLTDNKIATVVATVIAIFVLSLSLARCQILNLPIITAFLLITVFAFGAIRFLILFGVMAVYFLAQNLPEVNLKLRKYKSFKKINLVVTVLVIFLVVYDLTTTKVYFSPPNLKVLTFSWDDYCNFMQDCSERLTEAMLKNPPSGVGFNPYSYGGYLSWRVPQIKTFIDGRMSAWAVGDKTPPLVQSFQTVQDGGVLSFRQLDNLYHFRWVIIKTPTQTARYLEKLSQVGQWKIAYQDNNYSLYIKN